MADSRPIDSNGVVSRAVHFEDDKMHLETRMEGARVESILDSNQSARTHGVRKTSWGRHAARIPIPEYERWQREFNEGANQTYTWQEFLARKLSRAENAKFLTGVREISAKPGEIQRHAAKKPKGPKERYVWDERGKMRRVL